MTLKDFASRWPMSEASSTQQSVEMSSIYAAKAALRKSMLRTLRSIPDVELEQQSQAVAKILFDSPFFSRANSIGCYLSMSKGELRTQSIVREILHAGKRLYTPYISPAASLPPPSHSPDAPPNTSLLADTPDMRMLRLHSNEDLAACPLDKWGILDPGEDRRDVLSQRRADVLDPGSEPLDLILIPGVAFDDECNRLGRGKAFYDRFLLSYTSSRPSPLLVALALQPQILTPGDKIPTTDTDFQLDGVVSPSGIVWRAGREPRHE